VDAAAEKLTAQGVSSMLVVHGDLPLLSVEGIQQLLDQHPVEKSPVISIVADSCNDGSNCILATPPNCIPFQYGEGSFDKHRAVARQLSVEINILSIEGAARDIDYPADLEYLSTQVSNSHYQGRHSLVYLQQSGIVDRLQAIASSRHRDFAVDPDMAQQLARVLSGESPSDAEALSWANSAFCGEQFTQALMNVAGQLRDGLV